MLTLLQRWYQRHFSQPGTIEFALVLIVSFIIVYYFMWLVGPIVVALCLAFCLDWPVVTMQRRFALSRKIGSMIVMAAFSSFLIFTTIWVVPNVVKQGAEFYNSIVAFSKDDGSHKNKNQGANQGEEYGDNKQSQTKSGAALSSQKPLEAQGSALASGSFNDNKSSTQVTSLLTNQGITDSSMMTAKPGMSTTHGSLTGQGNLAGHSEPNSKDSALIATKSNSQLLEKEIDDKSNDDSNKTIALQAKEPSEEPKAESTENAGDKGTVAKRETTIVYIAPPQSPNGDNTLSSNEQMAKAVANAAMMAAEIEQAKNKEQANGKKQDTANSSTQDNSEGSDYHITLINGGSAHFSFDGNDESQFTLTVNDFDARLAKEIHDVILSMPEPLPSMLALSLIKNSVRSARVAATNKMADVMRTKLMPSVVNAFTWMVYALIVPIFTFLMLYNKETLQNRAKIFLLPNNQQLMRKFWPSMHSQIAGYIRGKLLHIIIIAFANTLAFMLLDMNYALLLGVGVGLSVVIPYVGAVIIAVPVVMVAIFQFGFSITLIWVLIIYTIIQLLDSNVLTPMLFSKTMNLDAFSILAAILIFGNLWGFWGVFFAIPLATFVKTIIVGWPNAEPHDTNGNVI